jgi:hypothetical protein
MPQHTGRKINNEIFFQFIFHGCNHLNPIRNTCQEFLIGKFDDFFGIFDDGIGKFDDFRI